MRTKTAVLALLPLGLWAQMNGGLTGFGMMGQAMTGMGAFGPVVGPDGTAYALRQSVANTGMMGAATAAGTDLVAINPADGTARWTLRVNGYMLSEPILAPDGRYFSRTRNRARCSIGRLECGGRPREGTPLGNRD